ncbi:MAG: hypothetical protein RMH81_02925 [Thermomicrobium sp.]|nr:hypothetical protein [Thermomicrobium sp.]
MAESSTETTFDRLLDRVRRKDRSALARAITVLEREHRAERLLSLGSRRATVVTVAGPPGAGKSTLLGALAKELAHRELSVAILAFDPVSPRSGGAILGDRVRMLESAELPNVFVRSLAARDPSGAGSSRLPALLTLLDTYGFDLIFLETVGAGQEASPLVLLADLVLLVLVPGLGDSVQTLKAGVLEFADVLVVNKADRPDAEDLVRDLSAYYRLVAPTDLVPPILQVIATRDVGIPAVADALLAVRQRYAETGITERRRQEHAVRCWQIALSARCQRVLEEVLRERAADAPDPLAWREPELYRELARRLHRLADSMETERS